MINNYNEYIEKRLKRTNTLGKVVENPDPVIGVTKTKYGYAISRNGNVGGITEELIRHDLGIIFVNQWDMSLKSFGGSNIMGTVFFETEGQAMNALLWIRSLQAEAKARK